MVKFPCSSAHLGLGKEQRACPLGSALPTSDEKNLQVCLRIEATVAQLVRAPVCGTGSRGFKSHQSPHNNSR